MENNSKDKPMEKKKKPFMEWIKDYVVNDVSPAENYFEMVSARRPFLKRWQWYINLALQIIIYASFIFAIVWASGQFISIGFEELNKSCDQCLARCAVGINKSSLFMNQTTLTMVGG